MASQRMITIPEAEYLQMQHQIKWLEHQLAELKRLVFGSKSERFIAAEDPAQLNLFDLPSPEIVPVMQQEITYVRNKAESREGTHPLRAELAAHLPRKVEVIEPQDLPSGAKKIGEVITETLEYQPANVFVRQIQRPKYVVEQTDESTTIVIAPLPSLPIPKGNAGASMIAHILVSKFVDHLPYYRQSQIFKRQNLYISDSTIGGWANTAIHNWLVPVWETMKTKLLEADYLMADETPIPVLSEDKPGATHRGFYWVYYDPVNKRVIFDYQKTRGREGPKGFLKSFTGHLQTDGYSVYDQLAPAEKIKHLACFSHARRKYEHALQNDQQRATKALTWIQQLYAIERRARNENYSYDQIRELRQEESLPILREMEKWLIDQKPSLLPKSAIGTAVNYTLGLWPRLIRYVEDGRFLIDNNLIENSLRPTALEGKIISLPDPMMQPGGQPWYIHWLPHASCIT
jgi:transposase